MSSASLPISVQIYSVRGIAGLDRQLEAIAAAGYRHVELIGAYLEQPSYTKAQLDAWHLTPSSAHVGMAALRTSFDTVISACKTIGINQLFMPSIPLPERDSEGPYWSALGHELGEFACRAMDAGIQFGYHNHNWEFRIKGSVTALELLFEGADGTPLTWQADVAWLVRAGVDPDIWLYRYHDRVASTHVKDIAVAGDKLDEDGWADVGSGTLEWQALLRSIRRTGAKWLVAEHDKPSDPVRFLRASRVFLSNLEEAEK